MESRTCIISIGKKAAPASNIIDSIIIKVNS